MNEITKEKVAEKVLFAIETEKLMNVEAAKHLGFTPAYLSMVKKHEQWDRCPESAWKKMRDWVSSGKTLREYIPVAVKEKAPAAPEPPKPPVPAPPTPTPAPTPAPTPPEQNGKPSADKSIKVTTTFVGVDEINKRLAAIRKEAKKKRKLGLKGKENKNEEKLQAPDPTEEEMENIISHIGLEIDVIIKLKQR